ncbi:MAG: DUF1425 domain-containing protein [Lentisphaerae bacterium]|nr:DUF1425 domain-containing protein [Lentisphaerota bacterium]
MKRISRIVVAALLVSLMLCVSCKCLCANAPSESHTGAKINMNDKWAASKLQVVDVVRTNQNGLLQTQVSVVNCTGKDLQFEYRYRWTTSAGMEVDGNPGVWIPVNIGAKQRSMLQGIAPNAEVQDFVVDVRCRAPNTRWE